MDPDRVREVVSAIPEGRWASYGDVALAAGGTLQHARTLNRHLIRHPVDGAHRVLREDGSVAATAWATRPRSAAASRPTAWSSRAARADPAARVRLSAAAAT